MMKKGFTLAEVLITLVIIGVVASMTIPTLMNSTQGTEYKTGFKKAMSTLNQAFSLNYAITATLPGEDDYASNKGMLDYFFKKRLSVISTSTSTSAFATGDGVTITASNDNNVFYTSDGMRYVFNIDNKSGVADSTGDKYYGTILVDVNGEKGLNRSSDDLASDNSEKMPDQLKMRLMRDGRVIVPAYDATSGNDWSFENEYLSSNSPTNDTKK